MDALDRFSETVAREVMTPRPDIVAIAAAAPVSALRRLMRETKYSRIPVYGKDLDDILGVVEVRDLLDFQGDPESPVSRPRASRPPRPRDEADRRAAAGDAGAADHLRGGRSTSTGARPGS